MAMQAVDSKQSVVSKIISELKDIRDRHEKLEEMGDAHPYMNLDKSQVVQETKVFHDANFVKLHPKRCCHHIAKLLFFITHGESFTASDSASVSTCSCLAELGHEFTLPPCRSFSALQNSSSHRMETCAEWFTSLSSRWPNRLTPVA